MTTILATAASSTTTTRMTLILVENKFLIQIPP